MFFKQQNRLKTSTQNDYKKTNTDPETRLNKMIL